MDPWLAHIVQRLKEARTLADFEAVIDELEDRYDAFSGPGQEWVDQVLAEARERLRNLKPPR